MLQNIKTQIRRARETSKLLSASDTLKVHLAKLYSNKRKAIIEFHINGFEKHFKIRARGTDLEVALQIFSERDYDLNWCKPYREHIHNLCRQVRQEGNIPLIVDAGANIGASTLLFASAFPECEVFAIEPDAGNFEMLQRNVRTLQNVRTFRAGLWDKPTSLAVEWTRGTGWAQRVKEISCPNSDTLASVTIPQLLKLDPLLRPIIVKIDIEGAEVQVLRSNNGWVDDVPLMIFEAHDNLWGWLGTWQGSANAFLSCLIRKKREYLTRGENVFAFMHPKPISPC